MDLKAYIRGKGRAVLEATLYPILSPTQFLSISMLIKLGYWPNLKHPRTYNEKVVHTKLFRPHPLGPLVADKRRVRQYVAEKGLKSILNGLLWVGTNPREIPFDTLPDQFVIKATHGSGWNLVVQNKNTLNRAEVVETCSRWLRLKYGQYSKRYEVHYDQIEPAIIIEEFLHDFEYGIPLDFKLYCFHGQPHYILVVTGRFVERSKSIYDTEWNLCPVEKGWPGKVDIPRPRQLERMLEVAAICSADFGACRVDLYVPNDERVVFGEITLTPSGGVEPFKPREWDFKLGSLWDLDAQKREQA